MQRSCNECTRRRGMLHVIGICGASFLLGAIMSCSCCVVAERSLRPMLPLHHNLEQNNNQQHNFDFAQAATPASIQHEDVFDDPRRQNQRRRQQEETLELSTLFLGGSAQAGIMFDIVSLTTNTQGDLTITDVHLHTTSNSQDSIEIWTKDGSFVGYEYDPESWYMVGCGEVIGAGYGEPTEVPSESMDWIWVAPGAIKAIYTTFTYGGAYMQYTDASGVNFGLETGEVFKADANLQILVGAGKTYYFGPATYSNRIWNGTLKYVLGAPARRPPFSPPLNNNCRPSMAPSIAPSIRPSYSQSPTIRPSTLPSESPTIFPSWIPSEKPSLYPTPSPTVIPSSTPSLRGSLQPTHSPSYVPSLTPTERPSILGSITPTSSPTLFPTTITSSGPSSTQSYMPSPSPSAMPSYGPSPVPSISPSDVPSTMPTKIPSNKPSNMPSHAPTNMPTRELKIELGRPTPSPTLTSSDGPSRSPTFNPSSTPTIQPSIVPSSNPSKIPTVLPSALPSSKARSFNPIASMFPSDVPSSSSSVQVETVAAVAAAAAAAAAGASASAASSSGGDSPDTNAETDRNNGSNDDKVKKSANNGDFGAEVEASAAASSTLREEFSEADAEIDRNNGSNDYKVKMSANDGDFDAEAKAKASAASLSVIRGDSPNTDAEADRNNSSNDDIVNKSANDGDFGAEAEEADDKSVLSATSFSVCEEYTEVRIHAMSRKMKQAKLINWIKIEGDQVFEHDAIAMIESNIPSIGKKYIFSPCQRGFIAAILVEEGEVAQVGSPIALIAHEEEAIPYVRENALELIKNKKEQKKRLKEQESILARLSSRQIIFEDEETSYSVIG